MGEHREIKYVWSWPIRLTHWITFLSVLVLTVSGYYIAFPPDFIAPKGEPFENFFMANLRFSHFLAAIVLVFCFLSATYLILFYRFHDLWRDIIPTASNLKRTAENLKFYFGFSQRHTRYEYLEPMALLSISSYTLIAFLLIFTGIALYTAPRAIHGVWLSILYFSSSWTVALFGGLQGVRVTHHVCMWILLAWFVVHVYFQVWKSIKLKQYDISAIVGGYKFIDVEE